MTGGFSGKLKSKALNYVRNSDWLLLFSCLAAAVYGIVLIYATTLTSTASSGDYLTQVGAVAIGLVAALIISMVDYDYICQMWPILAGFSLLLMGLTFTPLGIKAPGADEQAWLMIPFIKVTFQPSELLKIVFLVTFSIHLSHVREDINRIPVLLLVGAHGLLPIGLVILQGENGTAVVFGFMVLVMLLLAGLRPVYILAALTAVLAAVPIVWPRIPEDKQARILCIIPNLVEEHVMGAGYQQDTALTAIGSGQLWGKGIGGGKTFFARNNDFIFSVAGEEFGFVGSVLLLIVLAAVIFALLRDLFKARDLKGMLICGGMLAMIGSQTIINLGMNLRLLPVIGITLPFFSRGGSSVGTLLIGIGVVLSVYYSSRTRVTNTIFSKRRY